jgi:hypothetical protein
MGTNGKEVEGRRKKLQGGRDILVTSLTDGVHSERPGVEVATGRSAI